MLFVSESKGISTDRSVRRISYASAGRDPFVSYAGTEFCIQNPENINTCERVTNRRGPLLHVVITAIWTGT